MKKTDCTRDVTSAVRVSCQGQQSCSVPSCNANYGDPCSGTYKYLETHFICATASALEIASGISCPASTNTVKNSTAVSGDVSSGGPQNVAKSSVIAAAVAVGVVLLAFVAVAALRTRNAVGGRSVFPLTTPRDARVANEAELMADHGTLEPRWSTAVDAGQAWAEDAM